MKTPHSLRLVTKALTGAMLMACTVVQAVAADDVKVTELMTKDLINVPGKQGTMIRTQPFGFNTLASSRIAFRSFGMCSKT